MGYKKVTIKDVAKHAGISTATVSRYLNRDYPVSKETQEKIQRAIIELNYLPNEAARSLKTNLTATIGFLVSDISNPFFTAIGKGIENALKPYNYSIFFCSTDNSAAKELAYLRLLQGKKVDGIVVNTTGHNDEYIASLSQSVPIVLCNRKVNDPLFKGDLVDSDNVGGVATLTNHLISLGHRRIGFINGPLYLSTGLERFQGFCQAMSGIDIAVDKDYEYGYFGNFDFSSGYQGAASLMSKKVPPTAILSMNNDVALGALKYLLSENIRVPEDVSIVAFGSIPNIDLLYVHPTVSAFDLQILGEKIGSLIIERIQSQQPITNREIRYVTSLELGNSTRRIE